ncbi:hypothetical protein E1B28_005259 [Marasmius oreades]|uniref:Uncharacterized protein n=1 Tax=Marasmius oreades TaxID=181124 RepID=A0A9P8ADY3_9AGAR|nr:uncharacterized protein E1B28_005259 [Marasmius oreades]KAG7097948.1 hypothetical protein E1B28_005259 [Marasmius oreades]
MLLMKGLEEEGGGNEASPLTSEGRGSTPIAPNQAEQGVLDIWSPDFERHDELDVWSPHHDDSWHSLRPPPGPPDVATIGSSPPGPSLQQPDLPPTPSHWLNNPKLLGISILVDIKSGDHCTTNKRTGLFVKSVGGHKVRYHKTKHIFYDIPLEYVDHYRNRPRCDSLMIVARSDGDEHTGKLIRFVEAFYTGSGTAEKRWILCAVVDGVGRGSHMMGEFLELTMEQVEVVWEPDRNWANASLMRDIRILVGQKKKRRRPGTVTYTNLTAFVKSDHTSSDPAPAPTST